MEKTARRRKSDPLELGGLVYELSAKWPAYSARQLAVMAGGRIGVDVTAAQVADILNRPAGEPDFEPGK